MVASRPVGQATLAVVTERFAWAFGSARQAVELVLEDVVSVAPGWLVAGVVLHTLHQVIRTRGWFNIIRAAYPHATELRARDVTFAYLAGSGLNSVVPARGADLAKLYLIRRRAREACWSTLAATMLPETLFETAFGLGLVIWALGQGFLPVPTLPGEVPAVDVSLVMQHPFISTGVAAATGLACIAILRVLRARTRSGWLARLKSMKAWLASIIRAWKRVLITSGRGGR